MPSNVAHDHFPLAVPSHTTYQNICVYAYMFGVYLLIMYMYMPSNVAHHCRTLSILPHATSQNIYIFVFVRVYV